MTFYIQAAGCQMNISDTERIRTLLTDSGFTPGEEETADILGIVACSVRQKSIDKVFARINAWNRRKEKQPVITFLTGCVLPEDRVKFLKLFDLVFDTSEAMHLSDMIRQYGIVTGQENQDAFWKVTPSYDSPFEAFIPIQNGCNNFCAYCAVPYTRGREVSRDPGEIVGEYQTLLDRGYRSVTLLGQNVNSYGLDRKGELPGFPELLDRLGDLGDRAEKPVWLYYTAPHPKDMTDRVIEVMARHPSLARQIHLPLQSGDNDILKRMNRHYTVEDYGRIIDSIRKHLPDATVFTDIIVGFPGETEEQFGNTARAFERFRFDMAYIARYSPRPGAQSTGWGDDQPHEVKKERLNRLSVILKGIAEEKNRALTGRTLPVLVYGHNRSGKQLAGLTEGRVNIQFPPPDQARQIKSGEMVPVTITGAQGLSLSGSFAG
jgi:tRNA-2-methylthio-N6-dimethylallyladenosine synthase